MKFIFYKKRISFFLFLISSFLFNQSHALVFLANATKQLDYLTTIKTGHIGIMQNLIQNYSPEKPRFTLLLFSFATIGKNELKKFKDTWLDLLKSKTHEVSLCGIKTCASNDKENSLDYVYTFEEDEAIFISCDKYPNLKIQEWLRTKMMPSIAKDKPVVFFFYYSPLAKIHNPWTEYEKISFFEIIKEHNVKALIVGSHDFSYKSFWNRYEIPIYCVGGKYFALFGLTP